MKGGYPSDANVSETVSPKKKAESLKTKMVFTQNKGMFANKKTLIFEQEQEPQSQLLNEDNIKDNLDN
jgi:hypothetical protein